MVTRVPSAFRLTSQTAIWPVPDRDLPDCRRKWKKKRSILFSSKSTWKWSTITSTKTSLGMSWLKRKHFEARYILKHLQQDESSAGGRAENPNKFPAFSLLQDAVLSAGAHIVGQEGPSEPVEKVGETHSRIEKPRQPGNLRYANYQETRNVDVMF